MSTATYYNTTNQHGTALKQYTDRAQTQNDRILQFYEQMPALFGWTPSEVHAHLFDDDTPLTSVRRAITTLEKQGKLVKSEQQGQGKYGRPEYFWYLAN